MPFVLLLSAFFLFPLISEASFLPDSLQGKVIPSDGPSNITESQFNAIVQRIQRSYQEVVKQQGGTLTVAGSWRSEQLNAGAQQLMGQWRVVISGALARRTELTPDGFTLILCHEMGHHLGGFSFAPPNGPFDGIWAANEGQADYFATQVCARKLWAQEGEINGGFRATVDPFAKERCDTAWGRPNDQDLCYRIVTAAISVTNTMAALKKLEAPKLDTPDPKRVSQTDNAHPAPQCRLDTSFQGALCPVEFGEDVIPGKKVRSGPHSLEAEKESALRTCTQYSGQVFGRRPECWFKPRM
jgi:hypothetical protein